MLFYGSDHYNFLFLTDKENVIHIGSALSRIIDYLGHSRVSWSLFYTAGKSGFCTSFINSAFSGIMLRAFSHPCWEYLHQGNCLKLQIKSSSFPELAYQHITDKTI